MPRATALAELAGKIGHEFARPELLDRALTHSSHTEGAGAQPSYERLEFLGDRVLGLIIADMLLSRFPTENEGRIAKRLSAIVDRSSLAKIARELGLGDYLLVGAGDVNTGTADRDAVLADAMEAVIGAIYRDAGLEAARGFVERLWSPLVERDRTPPVDSKTALQEWAQARAYELPNYSITERTGPDHAPEFIVEVSLPQLGSATGKGNSKRVAEQNAAAALLDQVEAGS